MKYSELYKLLRRSGCTVFREGNNHTIWIAPNKNKFTVPRHQTQDVPKGTLRAILKATGIDKDFLHH